MTDSDNESSSSLKMGMSCAAISLMDFIFFSPLGLKLRADTILSANVRVIWVRNSHGIVEESPVYVK